MNVTLLFFVVYDVRCEVLCRLVVADVFVLILVVVILCV